MARCGALALGDLGPHQLDAIEVGKVRFPSGVGVSVLEADELHRIDRTDFLILLPLPPPLSRSGKVGFPSGGGSIKGSNEGAVDGRM